MIYLELYFTTRSENPALNLILTSLDLSWYFVTDQKNPGYSHTGGDGRLSLC